MTNTTKNQKTLKAMLVPVGDYPKRIELTADEDGSFLRAMQKCVKGNIEPMSWIFDDEPACYANEEGKIPWSEQRPNRAIFEEDSVEPIDIVFGNILCVGFDPETGEGRDITDEECGKVMERFGTLESILSGPIELMRLSMKHRQGGQK